MNQVPVLNFQGFEFTVMKNGDQLCITLGEIAKVLYGKGGVQSDAPFDRGIRQLGTLYRRHASEFTDSMTAVVKMHTAGGAQDVRVFSLRGAHLLGMFARTETAREFRRWVLDVVDEHLEAQRGLVPKFHATLLEYTSKKAVASICGRGLNQWKGEKPPLEQRMRDLTEQLQPSLLLN